MLREMLRVSWLADGQLASEGGLLKHGDIKCVCVCVRAYVNEY